MKNDLEKYYFIINDKNGYEEETIFRKQIEMHQHYNLKNVFVYDLEYEGRTVYFYIPNNQKDLNK